MQGSFVSKVEEINGMASWRIGPDAGVAGVGFRISEATASPRPGQYIAKGAEGLLDGCAVHVPGDEYQA